MRTNKLVNVNVNVQVGYRQCANISASNCELQDVPGVIKEAFANAARSISNDEQMQQLLGWSSGQLQVNGYISVNHAN